MDSNNPYAAPKAVVTDTDSGERGQLAGRGSRFGAAFVDGFVVGIISIPLFWYGILPVLTGESGFTAMQNLPAHSFATVTMITLLNGIVGATTFALLNTHLLRTRGQTIGKRAANIRIMRTDGTPADSRTLLKRYGFMYGIQLIPKLGPWIGLLQVLLIFRNSRQCGHDSFADTIVVKA